MHALRPGQPFSTPRQSNKKLQDAIKGQVRGPNIKPYRYVFSEEPAAQENSTDFRHTLARQLHETVSDFLKRLISSGGLDSLVKGSYSSALRPAELRDLSQLFAKWAQEREDAEFKDEADRVRYVCQRANIDATQDAAMLMAKHGLVEHVSALRSAIDRHFPSGTHARLELSFGEKDRISVHVDDAESKDKHDRLSRLAEDWSEAPLSAWEFISIYPV